MQLTWDLFYTCTTLICSTAKKKSHQIYLTSQHIHVRYSKDQQNFHKNAVMKTELKILCVMAITIATNDECVSRKSIKRPWRDLQCLSTTLWLTCRPGWQWQCTTYRSNSDWYVVQILCRPRWFSGWSVGVALRVIFWCSPHTASPLWNKTVIFWWSWTASQRGMKNILDQLPPFFHPWTTLPSRDNRFHLSHCHPKTSPGSQNRPCNPKNGPSTPQCA